MPSLRVWRVQKTITRARRIGTAPSGVTASFHSGEIPAIKIDVVVSFQCVYGPVYTVVTTCNYINFHIQSMLGNISQS